MPADGNISISSDDLRSRLEASRRALLAAIDGFAEDDFRAREPSDGWSPAEITAHLLSSEQLYMAWARDGSAKSGMKIDPVSADGPELQAEGAKTMAVPQIIHGLVAQRRDSLKLLADLTPEQLSHTLHYRGRGDFALGLLFRKTAEHETEHAAQIEALRLVRAGNS